MPLSGSAAGQRDRIDQLKQQGLEEYIRKTTGLVPDAYFSATKIAWILDHVPQGRERAKKGEILFGTVDSWLIWKLSGGKVHVTDYTNASRTMLFNINTLNWDEKLLNALDIPVQMLPQVKTAVKSMLIPPFRGKKFRLP